MGVSYKKLWVRMAENELKRTDLKDIAGVSSNTLAKLGKNEYVSLEVLERICRRFECDIGDIVVINYDKEKEDNNSEL